jgi:hypothetical protein
MTLIKTTLVNGKTEVVNIDNGNVIASIAHGNGYLSDTEVKAALLDGKTVYTSFNKYEIKEKS